MLLTSRPSFSDSVRRFDAAPQGVQALGVNFDRHFYSPTHLFIYFGFFFVVFFKIYFPYSFFIPLLYDNLFFLLPSSSIYLSLLFYFIGLAWLKQKLPLPLSRPESALANWHRTEHCYTNNVIHPNIMLQSFFVVIHQPGSWTYLLNLISIAY